MKTDEILQFFTITDDGVSFEDDVCELAVSNSLSPSGVGDTATGCLARKVVERSLQKATDAKPDTDSASFLGTQCHTVLQHLMELPPNKRTKQAVTRLVDELSKSGELVLPTGVKQGREFAQRVAAISNGLFAIEDPKKVKVIATEFNFETTIWGIPVRGSIDRIDELEDGTLRIVDYKTGKYRRPDPRFQDNYGPQLVVYALAAEQKFGRKVSVAVDYFVSAQEIHKVSITEEAKSEIRELAQRAWKRLSEVRESQTASFVPSGLCPWCPMVKICPAASEYAKDRASNNTLSVGAIKVRPKQTNALQKYVETRNQNEMMGYMSACELSSWSFARLKRGDQRTTSKTVVWFARLIESLIEEISDATPGIKEWSDAFEWLDAYEDITPFDFSDPDGWVDKATKDFQDFQGIVSFFDASMR